MAFLRGLAATLLISLCLFARDGRYLEGAPSSTPTTTTNPDEDTVIVQFHVLPTGERVLEVE